MPLWRACCCGGAASWRDPHLALLSIEESGIAIAADPLAPRPLVRTELGRALMIATRPCRMAARPHGSQPALGSPDHRG
jgi:hypothetical protein